MHLFWQKRFFLFLICACGCGPAWGAKEIWIWPGAYRLLVDQVAQDSVFLLQRNFDARGKMTAKGPSPWSWKVRDLTLVFRFSSAPQGDQVLNEFLNLRQAWEKRGVKVRGLQLDYDSPTSRLTDYRENLLRLKKEFKRHAPDQELSVTGLTDWLKLRQFDFAEDLTIYFQVYQGSREHRETDMSLGQLSRARFPFKIGILPNQILAADQLTKLQKNSRFQGLVEFRGGSIP